MLSFGTNLLNHSYKGKVFLRIDGKLIINGSGFHAFGPDCRINILETGTLEIGNNFTVENESRWLISGHSIVGNDNMFSWGISFLDTDAHPIYNEHNVRINKPSGFLIGNNVWIGCEVTVLKGGKISDGDIVASNSIVTRPLLESNAIYINNQLLKKNISWERVLDSNQNL